VTLDLTYKWAQLLQFLTDIDDFFFYMNRNVKVMKIKLFPNQNIL
jgi:hypothetical protein